MNIVSGDVLSTCIDNKNLYFLASLSKDIFIQHVSLPSCIDQVKEAYSRFSCALADAMKIPPFLSCPTVTQCFSTKLQEKDLVASLQRDRIETQVDELECGNKHGNLIKMANLVESLNLPHLKVPRPQAIYPQQVFKFLKKKAPEVFKEWKNLQDLNLDATAFSESKEVLNILNRIDSEIEKAFLAEDAYESLGIPDSIKQQKHFLMVRSTGAEDSHDTANAGGNKSEAYVPPEEKAICQAVGSVVRSYFGKISLLNRLKSNPSALSEPLKLGVTLQELIGEAVGGSKDATGIPVSFVLFSHEPLYVDVDKERFRVMRLSATLGHGEGVVGNRGIATDTILILRSESEPDKIYYLYDNQIKRERLAPVKDEKGQTVLSKIPNPPQLKNAQALSKEQIVSLYSSAILMESYFENHPTDIEGVIKEGKIYFVQARPVNRKPLLPTYVTQSPATSKMLAEKTLVIGKASALIVRDKAQIRLSSTLEEAQDGFLPSLVIVTGPEAEPENSHPVVNFSGLGVPCLHIPQSKQNIEEWVKQIDSEHPLVVCMQTGTLHKWDPSYGDPEDHIKEGFAVHPAKVAISISEDPSLLSSEGSSSFPKFEKWIRSQDSSDNLKEALSELDLYLKELEKKIANEKALPEALKSIRILERLKAEVSFAIQEIRAIFINQKAGERLPLLLNIQKLKTLVLGPDIANSQGIGQYSLANVNSLFNTISTLRSYQEEVEKVLGAGYKTHCSELVLYGNQNNEEAFALWRSFLLELESLIAQNAISEKELIRFKDLIQALHSTEALSFWMTFLQPSNKSLPAAVRFRDILSQVSKSDQNLIFETLKSREYILQLHAQKSRFADPKTFPLAWQEAQDLITTYTSQSWLDKIQKASPIAKVAIYRMMESLVDFVDGAGKQVKSSHQFEHLDHVKYFKEMLTPFHTLMTSWAQTLIPTQLKSWGNELVSEDYFQTINTIISQTPDSDEAQVLPSKGFSVSAAKLGSRSGFMRHLPKTAEDLWTLHHQNCLAVLTVLNQQMLSKEQMTNSLLPLQLKRGMQEIDTINSKMKSFTFQSKNQDVPIKIDLIGMHIIDKEMILQYNVPLFWHSGRLELHYDLASKKMTLKGQFLYKAVEKWSKPAEWITSLEKSGVFESRRPCLEKEQELTFYFGVDSSNLHMALDEFLEIADFSLNQSKESQNRALKQLIEKRYEVWKDKQEFSKLAEYFIKAPTSHLALLWHANIAQNPPKDVALATLAKKAAIKAATEGILSIDFDIQYASITLLEILVDNRYIYSDALSSVAQGMSSPYQRVRKKASALLKTLEKKQSN